MAEAVMVVCDECGKPEATSITIRADGRNYVKDLCSQHLGALLKDTRSPRRGRPRGATSSGGRTTASKPTASTRRRSSSTKRTASAKPVSKKKAATRRG